MWKSLLSLFLQDKCPLCQRNAKRIFCLDCQRQLEQCQFENKKRFWQGELPLFVWGKYDGTLKRAIASLKYDNNPQIGELMGFWLGKSWLDALLLQKYPKIIVIPIPMHPQKLKERGFNQAELIARTFCHFTGYPLNNKGLIRVKKTEALFSLKPQERKEQLNQAFALTKYLSLKDKLTPILLLDDIYTTGTTAQEAKKNLENRGFKVLGIAAIASSRK